MVLFTWTSRNAITKPFLIFLAPARTFTVMCIRTAARACACTHPYLNFTEGFAVIADRSLAAVRWFRESQSDCNLVWGQERQQGSIAMLQNALS